MVVYTRAGCPPCDRAEADVARICADLGCGWATVDIDTDPTLRAEYGDRVPVIEVDAQEHAYWQVDETRLRRALT